jgi:hypothetical protein
VRCGAADVAVTNEPSRREAGLVWLSCRPGVDIVWLVFARAPSEPRNLTDPSPDTDPEEPT